MCIFGRPTRDLIPILPGKYHPHQTWRESLLARVRKPWETGTWLIMKNGRNTLNSSHPFPSVTKSEFKTRLDPTQTNGTRLGQLSKSTNTINTPSKWTGVAELPPGTGSSWENTNPFMIRNQNEPFWKISPSFNQILQLSTHYPPPPPPISITTGSPNHPISSPEATNTDLMIYPTPPDIGTSTRTTPMATTRPPLEPQPPFPQRTLVTPSPLPNLHQPNSGDQLG